jgi:eukaryotic-like serine/threonine-protein kinase
MISSDNLCMNCMREIGTEKKCPHCGFHVDTVQPMPYLPIRTVIANRYLVGAVVEHNGEGVTYIGWDIKDRKAINIREFMPDAFTTRTDANLNLQVMLGSEGAFAELRRSFEELWSKLAKLSGLSALINVTDVVEDFSTSYAIYDHFDGISLRDFLLRSKTGYITWEKARQLLMPTLSTIGTLHKNGVIHRGISPTTLIIGEDGKIKITGFSIGEVRTEGGRLSAQIYDGYAAIEQCGQDYQQGPWTDIYAFAAVLYRTLIGSDPIPSKERIVNDRLMVPGKFAEALPAYVINGLINALQILPQDRTKTVEQLRADLSASPAATASSVQYNRQRQAASVQPKQAIKPQPPKKKKMKPGAIIGVTAGSIALVGILIFSILALTVFKDKFTLPGANSESTTVAESDDQVAVPTFEGRSYYDIAANPVFSENFKLKEEEVYSSDVASGYIISQSIAADTLVNKGTEIILYVSKGTEKIVLPNVVGSTYDEAFQKLTDLGFDVVKTETTDGTYADNEVVRMSLAAEQSYEKGTQVTLQVFVAETETGESDDSGDVPFSFDDNTTTEPEVLYEGTD